MLRQVLISIFILISVQARSQGCLKDSLISDFVNGKLVLKSNSTTRFAVQFVKNPLIENPNNTLFGNDEDEETPEGVNLIANRAKSVEHKLKTEDVKVEENTEEVKETEEKTE